MRERATKQKVWTERDLIMQPKDYGLQKENTCRCCGVEIPGEQDLCDLCKAREEEVEA